MPPPLPSTSQLGLPFKKLVAEWRVTPDALLPVGTHVGAAHYVAGQRVDVTGWTKFKGFQVGGWQGRVGQGCLVVLLAWLMWYPEGVPCRAKRDGSTGRAGIHARLQGGV